ncbi:MAG: hypothetical protein ACTSVE_11570 [Candidatus Helarchaeota archaeon]
MTRYSSSFLYSFEFTIILLVLLITLYLGKKKNDWRSLKVYLIAGIIHSTVELIAEGTGTRIIENPVIYGIIPFNYPLIPFVLGFFEGGFFCLMAFYLVCWLSNKDNLAKKIFILFGISMIIFLTIVGSTVHQAILLNPSTFSFTRREMFNLNTLLTMIIMTTATVIYFALKKGTTKRVWASLFYFWLGMYLFTAFLVVPLHIFGIRFIEVQIAPDTFVTTGILEQIIMMYLYNAIFESTLFFLPNYAIFYQFKIISIDEKK